MNGKSGYLKLGIDAGTYSIKAVVLNDADEILIREECQHKNKVKDAVSELLDRIEIRLRNENIISETESPLFMASCTGARAGLLNLPDETVSETQAICEGARICAANAGSMIVLGAQKTYYISLHNKSKPEIMKNTNCSAGTGSFFEEQAGRLKIALEDISGLTGEAKSIPRIAGRCSVFSKTDMIHLMQEGTPTPDILLGLCFSMVRNYKTSILHNCEVEKPVFLAGGVMKNAGVIRALKDELKLEDKDIILDGSSDYVSACGAALCGHGDTLISLPELKKRVLTENETAGSSGLAPLYGFVKEDDKPEFKLYPFDEKYRHFLGIDIGSTSINLVLINELKQVVYYSYVRTLGKPLQIVREEIDKLKQEIPGLKISRTAVTGSGREYISAQIGADLVINEITAQTEGALISRSDIDTIFEIGGQDSKYMSVSGHRMTDFEMNKVCAAGTGAFLEEQIRKLGISMEEFLNLAMKSENPCALGDRCTVFIEGSIYRALGEGRSMEDVCAGLAYVIVSNYLNRVVNRKRIGDNIALQGGIAYNEAVICAFRSLTGKNVHVTGYFAVTGALGAASLSMSSEGLSFDKEKNRALNEILLKKSEESYLKDYVPPQRKGKGVIGIPRVIFLHKMFPLFNKMFTSLGYEVLLSPLTDSRIAAKAADNATAEVCYPIKLIYGHIAWLLEQGVDYILLPRLYTIKHEGSVARKDYACMYMQTSPLLMEQAFHFKERGVTLIMPELSLQFGKKYMLESILSIAPQLNIPKPLMLPAAAKGFAALTAHTERLEAIGEESLKGDEPIFVLISRVYNIADPVLNMGIEEHLTAIGCRVIHLEHLKASVMHVEHDYPDMYWPFGQHILTGLKLVKAHPNMYPIYITNHGCGPDTAIQHFFQNEMQGRDYLQLEVDEHTSKVGVITRLEAFLYSLRSQDGEGSDSIVYGAHKCEGCTACADRGTQPELSHFEKILIPEYGIYSDIIEEVIRKDNAPMDMDIVRVRPLKEHKSFNYAMNKEYFSFLVMLEELLSSVQKGCSYVMVAPIDEGSEAFGQYALLCVKELNRLGFDVTLHHFYIEDIIKRDDHADIYGMMLEKEKSTYRSHEKGKRSLFAVGEPMCMYKEYICGRNLPVNSESFCVNRIPYSEILLFHMIETDRKGEYRERLSKWRKLHDGAMKECAGTDVYTDMDRLFEMAEGRLDFCIGDAGKYRLAKLLSLDPSHTDDAVVLNSSEENTAIILKQLIRAYKDAVRVPVMEFDLDFEHGAGNFDYNAEI